MKRVLTAGVLVPLVLLLVFRAPLWLFVLAVGGVVLVCLHEYLKIVERYGIKPLQRATYLVAILVVIQTYIFFAVVADTANPNYSSYLQISQNLRVVIVLLMPVIFGIPLVFRRELSMALGAAATSAFGVFYIAVPLALMVEMRWTPGRSVLLVFVLISVWAGDIAAYYVGKNIGRHKLAPLVSPNKTWEGAIASLVVSVAVAGVIFRFYQQINRCFTAFPSNSIPGDTSFNTPQPLDPLIVYSMGAIANIAAQFGDLFESAIKRGAQVKDSGSLLPGHGGVLDRIDALLFAVPTVWYYAMLTQFLSPGS